MRVWSGRSSPDATSRFLQNAKTVALLKGDICTHLAKGVQGRSGGDLEGTLSMRMDPADRDLVKWALERRDSVRVSLQEFSPRGGIVVSPEDLASLRAEEQILTEMLNVAGYQTDPDADADDASR